jgi:integrase
MQTLRKPDKFPFPLWWHPRGGWTKKIRQRLHYFGQDRDAALAEYVRTRADLEAGRVPRPKLDGGITVADLCNQFLTAKRLKVDAGELSGRQWSEYHAICDRLCSQFGKERIVADLRPEDFGELRAEAAERLGVFALAKFVQMVRTVFIFAFERGLIDVPMRYADSFDKPPRRAARLAREDAGSKMIDAATAWKLIDAADVQLKAMILLGLNCGYGNGDCATLNRSMLTDRPGWLAYRRNKTGIARRCPLWPETMKALEAVRKVRPEPIDKADADAVFLTRQGRRYVRFDETTDVRRDSIRDAILRTAKRAGVELPGGFYLFRHVHRTVADGAKDRTACDLIMGHHDPSQAATYLEGVDDSRLEAVANHVRAWLLEGKKAGAK